jgi:23S rRNA pseudouridine1911/1915/1917 synthase
LPEEFATADSTAQPASGRFIGAMNGNQCAMLEILLQDGPLLAVNKPAGLLTLGAIAAVPTLERQVKAYLKDKYQKPGNVYLGIPHRLDRPVSGVVVFARNSKAAARLAEQFRCRRVSKVYWALVERSPQPAEGELVDWLRKVPDQARVGVVPEGAPGAREARLRYRTLQVGKPTLLEIEPLTGRMHQIRAQLAARGWPVVGDAQYGAATRLGTTSQADPRDEPIGLHARSLTIRHPIRYDELTIVAPVPESWQMLAEHFVQSHGPKGCGAANPSGSAGRCEPD